MSLKLEVVDPAVDFPELVECKWKSYEIPYQSFWRLFNPIIGTGPNARENSLRQATVRQEKGHLSDPASHWLKVTDSNNGNKIVAGAWWKIYSSNPFEEKDDEFEAFWFPEGGQRDFATAAIRQHDAPRARMGRRSQVYLNIIFTHPDYRRQGAGDMLMEWGIKEANKLGVEMWLDASVYGVPLYKKHGFVVVHENDLCPKKAEGDKSEEWKELEAALCPMTMWTMWRPVGGKYEEGVTKKPWED